MMIISHRGASGYAPENTLKSFELAVKMGSRAYEFDVHRTRDGVLVVHHDFDLKRTAGSPVRIAALSYDELSKINVAAHFTQDPSFQRVPRLEEVLDVIAAPAEWLNFEVKNDDNLYPGIEASVTDLLKARGIEAKSLISSFDHGTLRRFRALSPGLRLGYLGHNLGTALLLPAMKKAREVGAVNFHMNLRLAFGLNVAKLKREGFNVCIYTVNQKADALRMRSIGVDGIFSNYPDILEK